MIVKDEAHIITRTFDNLLKYFTFNCYIISDTGSTDGTQEIIKNYFSQKGIPGEVYDEPWVAFDHNRSLALKNAYKKSDYLLIFDADDSIVGNFVLPKTLTCSSYNLKFGKGFTYKRPLLINNNLKWYFVGVLHEYLECKEPNLTQGIIDGDYYVDSGRLGTRSKNPNKYADDAIVLEKAFVNEKDSKLRARYAFYCAQSFKDSHNVDKAIEWYTLELKQNAWAQEKYYSALTLGDLYAAKRDYLNATKYWIKSSEYDPERIEGIVKACTYYRQNESYLMVDLLYSRFKNYQVNFNDKLFIDNSFYLGNLEFEFSVVAFYVGKKEEGYRCLKNLFLSDTTNKKTLGILFHNLQFYLQELNNDQSSTLDFFYKYDSFINANGNPSKENYTCWNVLYEKNVSLLTKYSNYKLNNNKDKVSIVFTFTTCKRLDLFKKTLNSILLHFEDLSLVDYFYCVDDNSSKADRAEMQKKYPWIKYYFKNEEERGHLTSMNLIYQKLTELNAKYWIHMEDDFLFYKKMKYITLGMESLKKYKNKNVRQVLFNRAYGETIENLSTKGYIESQDPVVIHEYNPGKITQSRNVYYWPHYSFRPSIIDFSTIKELGDYTTTETFFERTYADRWEAAGYKSAYFNFLTNRHIGRLTSEMNDPTKKNAYALNGTDQFEKKSKLPIKIINLERREDRKMSMTQQLKKEGITDYTFIKAVDSLTLQPTEEIINLCKGNDHSNRKTYIACAMSHYNLWKDLLNDSETDYYLVIEDDAVFNKNFKQNILKLIPDFYNKDMILLGYLGYSNKITDDYKSFSDNTTKLANLQVLNKKILQGGTHCYSINKNGAKKLIDYININGIKHGIDYLMYNCVKELMIYETKPMLAFADWHEGLTKKVDSDIQYNLDLFKF
jgi:GR25 family glycosyltransferase involved in LPS biosynthesis